jgi:hypothetical protein
MNGRNRSYQATTTSDLIRKRDVLLARDAGGMTVGKEEWKELALSLFEHFVYVLPVTDANHQFKNGGGKE